MSDIVFAITDIVKNLCWQAFLCPANVPLKMPEKFVVTPKRIDQNKLQIANFK